MLKPTAIVDKVDKSVYNSYFKAFEVDIFQHFSKNWSKKILWFT